jgi:hypothetical protein
VCPTENKRTRLIPTGQAVSPAEKVAKNGSMSDVLSKPRNLTPRASGALGLFRDWLFLQQEFRCLNSRVGMKPSLNDLIG